MRGGQVVDVRADSTAKWQSMPGQTAPTPPEEPHLVDRIEQLFEAGKEVADAEVAWVKARAGYIVSAATWIAGLGAAALILAFGLIVTLMVGSVLALAPHIGLGLAVLAVCVAGIVMIFLCVLAIKQFVRRIAYAAK